MPWAGACPYVQLTTDPIGVVPEGAGDELGDADRHVERKRHGQGSLGGSVQRNLVGLPVGSPLTLGDQGPDGVSSDHDRLSVGRCPHRFGICEHVNGLAQTVQLVYRHDVGYILAVIHHRHRLAMLDPTHCLVPRGRGRSGGPEVIDGHGGSMCGHSSSLHHGRWLGTRRGVLGQPPQGRGR